MPDAAPAKDEAKPKTPAEVDFDKKVYEATTLRMKLEKLADAGLFDLTKPEIRDAHTRLDVLEAHIYRARNVKP